MDRDRLINLLPEEYLPEPEFKAFPLFAAVLIILTILFVYMSYQTDKNGLANAESAYKQLEARVQSKMIDSMPFLDVQRNARFIASYLGVIPNMVLQAPDYWEIYNEVERLLPERTWVQSMGFRGGGRIWPNIVINFLSKGYSFDGPLATYDAFMGKPEEPTRFIGLQMNEYHRIMLGPEPGSTFAIAMRVTYPPSMRIEDKGLQEEETNTEEETQEEE